jgi:rubredoxin
MDDDLSCPACGAEVGYDDVGIAASDDDCQCPVCGVETPTSDWFQ